MKICVEKRRNSRVVLRRHGEEYKQTNDRSKIKTKTSPQRSQRRLRTQRTLLPESQCFFFAGTSRLLVTENTPGTPFARMLTRFLSPVESTTPSRVTCPRSTIMWMGRLDPTP